MCNNANVIHLLITLSLCLYQPSGDGGGSADPTPPCLTLEGAQLGADGAGPPNQTSTVIPKVASAAPADTHEQLIAMPAMSAGSGTHQARGAYTRPQLIANGEDSTEDVLVPTVLCCDECCTTLNWMCCAAESMLKCMC